MDGYPFALYHIGGCEGPCFLLSERPKAGDITDPTKAIHLDGRRIYDGEIAVCDTCGATLHWFPVASEVREYP